jgi:hydroxymethylbilane synthase
MKIIAGLRGSELSQTQTDWVLKLVRDSNEDIDTAKKIIRTSGDILTDKHILDITNEGVFEKEVNRAVAEHEVDFAVHSMKDLPTEYDSNLMIAAVPARESPFDTLVSKDGLALEDVPKGSIIGTGSPRREAQIRYLRPDLQIKHIRGNVDTRIRKLGEKLYDAIVLSEAGLSRLKIKCRRNRLPPSDFIPSPGQGALAITIRKDRKDLLEIFDKINHSPSLAEITAERTFLFKIGGGCKVPIGALARTNSEELRIQSVILSPDGQKRFDFSFMGKVSEPEHAGKKVAELLIDKTGGLEKMVK